MGLESKVGPYLRALAAGLHALAPNEDFVPLRPALAHVFALDPAMSGQLLDPPSIDPRSGMPGFAWMERALAEQTVARERDDDDDPTDDALANARRLDPQLGERLVARRTLHRHLRREDLLPTTRLLAVVRQLRGSTRVAITYDRMAPMGFWVRMRVELATMDGRTELGALYIDERAKVHAEPGLRHLLARHSFTPLMLLREQVEAAVDAEVVRLSRSQIGPFWFPESDLPGDVPPQLGTGLLLHTSVEMMGEDIKHSGHRDPWVPPPAVELIPEGYGVFRERRLAASLPLMDATLRWCEAAGVKTDVVPIRPRAVAAARR